MVAFRAGGTTPADLPRVVSEAGELTYLADVSEFQPNVADKTYLSWSKAICVRAAFGNAHDDGAWYNGARRKALHDGGVRFLGIYQFLVAGEDGTSQANALHDLVGPLEEGEVLIADFEQGTKPMLSAWYNRMLALGYPGKYLWTYTGLWFGEQQGALPVQWLADYTSVEPSGQHVLWQFTSNFSVPGVGTADCSVFHGTIDQLAALAYSTKPAPPPANQPTPAPGGTYQAVRPTGYQVTCSWHPVAGQTSYHFQIQWYKNGFGWVMYDDAHQGAVTTTLAVAPGTRYRWRVAAGVANYVWSDWEEFTTP